MPMASCQSINKFDIGAASSISSKAKCSFWMKTEKKYRRNAQWFFIFIENISLICFFVAVVVVVMAVVAFMISGRYYFIINKYVVCTRPMRTNRIRWFLEEANAHMINRQNGQWIFLCLEFCSLLLASSFQYYCPRHSFHLHHSDWVSLVVVVSSRWCLTKMGYLLLQLITFI